MASSNCEKSKKTSVGNCPSEGDSETKPLERTPFGLQRALKLRFKSLLGIARLRKRGNGGACKRGGGKEREASDAALRLETWTVR